GVADAGGAGEVGLVGKEDDDFGLRVPGRVGDHLGRDLAARGEGSRRRERNEHGEETRARGGQAVNISNGGGRRQGPRGVTARRRYGLFKEGVYTAGGDL